MPEEFYELFRQLKPKDKSKEGRWKRPVQEGADDKEEAVAMRPADSVLPPRPVPAEAPAPAPAAAPVPMPKAKPPEAPKAPTPPRPTEAPKPVPAPSSAPKAAGKPEAIVKTAVRPGSPATTPARPQPKPPVKKKPGEPADDLVVIRVRRETLLLAAILAFALFGGAFYWGFQQGVARYQRRIGGTRVVDAAALKAHETDLQKRPTSPLTGKRPAKGNAVTETERVPETGDTATTTTTTTTVPTGRRFSLRVMTYLPSGAADGEAVLEFLRDRGYDAYKGRSGRHIVLCIGSYQSTNDAELKRIKAEMRVLRYKGKRVFEDCYIAAALKRQ